MTGEQLYELWSDAMDDQGVNVDDWDELEESDRAAWVVTAAQVQLKVS